MNEPKVEIRRTGDAREVEARIDLEASPEAIWKALTEAEELTRWFPFEAETTSGLGGRIAMSWEGEWASEGEIVGWEPGRHLRTVMTTEKEMAAGQRPMAIDYAIEAKAGGGAKLRLVQSGFPASDAWDGIFDAVRRGWTFQVQALKHYLENHRGKDRRVHRVRRPMNGHGERQLWQRLWSADGLALQEAAEPGPPRARYRLALPGGPALEGRVLVSIPPRDFGGVVENAGQALFAAYVGQMTEGDAPNEVQIWFTTWGPRTPELEAIESALDRVLDRIL